MSLQHHVLIRISVELVSGLPRLQSFIHEIKGIGKVVSGSSVYKRFLNSRMEDLNSELLVVVKVETSESELEIFDFLKKKEVHHPGVGIEKPLLFTLLAYDQETRLVPGENLPNPLLHQDALTLRCASEAWGSYEHPVLGQTLNELVKSNQHIDRTEFFSQFTINK